MYTYQGIIKEQICNVLIDSGASANFISKTFLSKCLHAKIRKSDPNKVKLPNGSYMSTSEYIQHSIWLGNQVTRVKFVVIDL